MLIGFSRHGKGEGAGVVGYIAGADAVGYVAGVQKSGKARDPAPVVIRGDPAVARHLIDLVPYRWKYTSAMVSFSPGERITPPMERQVMDEFERCAFAGLDRSRFYLLAVRHQDGPGGCHHLHLVTPRMDLLTGKSLNIAPPGKASRELFRTFRSKMSAELGVADPDDPARIQTVRLPHHVAKARARARNSRGQGNEDARVLVTRHLEEKAREGLIKNREDVARYFRESGFTITREGANYLTVQNQETGQRVRLRGGLYDRDRCQQVLAGIRDGKQNGPFRNPERMRELEEKLERLVATRAEHNLKRYGPNIGAAPSKERFHDRTGTPSLERLGALDERIRRARGARRTALERVKEATQRWPSAMDELTRGIRATRDVRERLERATQCLVHSSCVLDRAIERARERRRERQVDQDLISKYGAAMLPPSRSRERERGFEREMERDFA